MLARQLTEGAETTISFKPGLHFSVKAKAGFLDINGQQIRVGWHASLPLQTFECPRCGKPKYKLSYVNGVWWCARCHGLSHTSRHRWRGAGERGRRARIEWLRRRVGADPRPGAPSPSASLRNLRQLRLAIELRDLELGYAAHNREKVSNVVEKRLDDRRRRQSRKRGDPS